MSAQFFVEWNNTFDYKLRESDLKQPTETMLFGALSNYLEHININVTKMHEDSMLDEKSQLQFKAEFCAYIDRLLKISRPTDHFKYYDLVQPNSNKTTYLLKLLLNYYHYFNMMKSEVEKKSDSLIKKYQTAVAERDQCLQRNRKTKEQEERVSEQLRQLAASMPDLQKNVVNLKKDNEQIDAEIAKTQAALAETKLETISMQQNMQELRDAQVTNKQVEKTKEMLASLDNEYAELMTVEESYMDGKADSTAMLEAVDANIELITAFLAKNTIEDATSAKLLETQLKKHKTSIVETTTSRDILQRQIVAKSEEYKATKSLLEQQIAQISEAKVADEQTILKLKRKIIEFRVANAWLVDKSKANEKMLRELQETNEFIIRESRKLLGFIRS